MGASTAALWTRDHHRRAHHCHCGLCHEGIASPAHSAHLRSTAAAVDSRSRPRSYPLPRLSHPVQEPFLNLSKPVHNTDPRSPRSLHWRLFLSCGRPKTAGSHNCPLIGTMMRHAWLAVCNRYWSRARRDTTPCSRHHLSADSDHRLQRWIRERAEALLELRCIQTNGDWQSFIDFAEKRTLAKS